MRCLHAPGRCLQLSDELCAGMAVRHGMHLGSEAFESALGILEQMWEDEQSEDREQEEEQTGGRGELVQHMADGGHEPERST